MKWTGTTNIGLSGESSEIVKEGEESQWGKFGDPDQIQTCQHLLFQSKSNKTGLQYYSILYHREGNFYPAYRFFTTGSTGRLNLVVTITIPGKLVALGGGWWSRAGGERDGAVRLQAVAQGSEALRRRPHQTPKINVRQIIIIANGINSQTPKLQRALAWVLDELERN